MNEIRGASRQINTFIFKREWAEYIRKLSDKQAGQLMKAIFAHTGGYDIELDTPEIERIRQLITAEIDIEAFKYILKKGE